MLRLLPTWLPGVLVLCATSMLFAQATDERYALPRSAAPVGANDPACEPTTPAPPAWNDGASVYLTGHQQAAEPEVPQHTSENAYDDPRVAQAVYQQADRQSASSEQPQRRLAPPSGSLRTDEQSSAAADLTKSWGLPLDSLVTTITALVLVVGLFLLCMWAMRRGTRHATGRLPSEVVSVLGSMPLGGRQMAQLLRVGNKLVLISVTPSGAQPLAEVTDAAEVDRLLGLCAGGGARSSSTNYERTFRPLTPELNLKGLPEFDSPLAKAPSASDLYRAYQGGTERAQAQIS